MNPLQSYLDNSFLLDSTPLGGGGDEGADDEEAEDVSSVTALVLVSDLLPLAAAAFLRSISESWGEIQLQLLFRMKPALILVFFFIFQTIGIASL